MILMLQYKGKIIKPVQSYRKGFKMENKRLVIMAGLPGSGKSYVREKRFKNLKTIDCDILKKKIAGYDPKNPGAVHAQSKVLETQEIHKALGAGESFVYDTTATNWAKVVKLIQDAKAVGFTVELCYVKVSLRTAIKRNANRERVVPEALIKEKYSLLPIALEVLSGYVDSYIVISND